MKTQTNQMLSCPMPYNTFMEELGLEFLLLNSPFRGINLIWFKWFLIFLSLWAGISASFFFFFFLVCVCVVFCGTLALNTPRIPSVPPPCSLAFLPFKTWTPPKLSSKSGQSDRKIKCFVLPFEIYHVFYPIIKGKIQKYIQCPNALT